MANGITPESLGLVPVRKQPEVNLPEINLDALGLRPITPSGEGLSSQGDGTQYVVDKPISEYIPEAHPFRFAPKGERFVERLVRASTNISPAQAIEIGLPTAGMVIGTPGGPVTMAAGGVGGAAAGRATTNWLRAIEDWIKENIFGQELKTDAITRQPSGTNYQEIINMGGLEAAFQTLAPLPIRLVSGALKSVGKLTSVTGDDVTRAINEPFGNIMGASDLASVFAQSAVRVAGVMPIIGGPYKRQAAIKTIEIGKFPNRLFDDISPPVDLILLSAKLTDDQLKAASLLRQDEGKRWGAVYNFLEEVGDNKIIPTDRIKKGVALNLKLFDELPLSKDGEPVGFAVDKNSNWYKQIESFLELDEKITIKELRALMKNINNDIPEGLAQTEPNIWRVIQDIGKNVHKSIEDVSPRFGKALADEFSGLLGIAKAATKEKHRLFNSAAATPTRNIDRNFFMPGYYKPGNLNVDELAGAYLSKSSLLRSPEFISDFVKLSGKQGEKNRRALARKVFEQAANITSVTVKSPTGQGVLDVPSFDATAFAKKLGISEGSADTVKNNRAALNALLKGTGLTAESLGATLRNIGRIQGDVSKVPSASPFLMRRVTLGGPSSLAGLGALGLGATAGAGVALLDPLTSLLTVGFFVLGGRQLTSLLSSPRGLALLRNGLDVNLTKRQIFQLGQKILDFTGRYEQDYSREENANN